jgi:hypothetical protein
MVSNMILISLNLESRREENLDGIRQLVEGNFNQRYIKSLLGICMVSISLFLNL